MSILRFGFTTSNANKFYSILGWKNSRTERTTSLQKIPARHNVPLTVLRLAEKSARKAPRDCLALGCDVTYRSGIALLPVFHGPRWERLVKFIWSYLLQSVCTLCLEIITLLSLARMIIRCTRWNLLLRWSPMLPKEIRFTRSVYYTLWNLYYQFIYILYGIISRVEHYRKMIIVTWTSS